MVAGHAGVVDKDASMASEKTGAGKRPASDGARAAKAAPPTCFAKSKKLFIKWFLPICLVVGIIIGLAAPPPGKAASDTPLGTICIVIIFFISGLKLKTDEIKQTLSAWREAGFGFASILLLTPLIAFAVVKLPLEPHEFTTGVGLFAVMPTTLSSGYILTGEAGGNQPLALMLSVGSNLLAVISVPLWLSAVLNSTGVEMDAGSLLLKLVLSLLLPLIAGRLLQRVAAVRGAVKKYNVFLKLGSAAALCLIPWMKVSDSAEDLEQVTGGQLALMFVLGISLHIVFLVFNYTITAFIPDMRLSDRKAVVIMGSQKTLGIAAAVLEFMPPGAGSQGLIIVPVLVSHLSQILMDAPMAVRWSAVQDKPVKIVKRSGKRRVLRLDSHGSFRQPCERLESGSDDGSSSAMPLASPAAVPPVSHASVDIELAAVPK